MLAGARRGLWGCGLIGSAAAAAENKNAGRREEANGELAASNVFDKLAATGS